MNFPRLYVGYYLHQKILSTCPSPDHRLHIRKKVYINFIKRFACIFSYTIMNYLKKLVGTKSLIQTSVQQDYLPVLFPIILHLYGKPCRFYPQGRIPPNGQKFTHSPHQKNPDYSLYKNNQFQTWLCEF